MDCLKDNNNPVVVVESGVDVTLKPDEELVAVGTVQVATNAEVSSSVAIRPAQSAAQTTHNIY